MTEKYECFMFLSSMFLSAPIRTAVRGNRNFIERPLEFTKRPVRLQAYVVSARCPERFCSSQSDTLNFPTLCYRSRLEVDDQITPYAAHVHLKFDVLDGGS